MPNLYTALSTLRRPRLLIRAAQVGLSHYERARDLKRLTGQLAQNSPETNMEHLLAIEEQIEETRRMREASYRPSQHIELLVALMAEHRLLTADREAKSNWKPA